MGRRVVKWTTILDQQEALVSPISFRPVHALEGKAVVITGAGRGIGAACARRASAEGAAVVVNDVDASAAEAVAHAICEAGGRAVANAADISTWEGAGALMAQCEQAFGRIDGLVNNAGVFHMASVEEERPEAVERIVRVNVIGATFCGIHAIRRMLSYGGGAVVNVTSGAHAGTANLSAYGMTKGAVASITYAWAAEVGARGIRVNAISPVARSRMSEAVQTWFADHGWAVPKQSVLPENNAPLVCYLLSDLARGVQGQVVRMQGRKLSLMTHPAVLMPVLERDDWTLDDVRRAFEETLATRQVPVGLAALHVEVLSQEASYAAGGGATRT